MNDASDTLLWCLLPDFDLQLKRPASRPVTGAALRHLVRPESSRRFTPTQHAVYDGMLFAWRAENERRVLFPLFDSDPTPLEVQRVADRIQRRAITGVEHALVWINETLTRVKRMDLLHDWRNAALTTQWHRMHYGRLDLTSFRCVVVPRQSHPYLRALIEAADTQGIPTAYIPHSPLTHWQADLPVTHAGLRGPAEIDFIQASTAADPTRLSVIGNPGSDLLGRPMPPTDMGRPGVFALAPEPLAKTAEAIELLRMADLQRVVVAPHPRTDRRALKRLIPDSWTVYDGTRTSELLCDGAPWVIQPNSGVAWEAAVLGIPTGNLMLGTDAEVYPFLANPLIPTIMDQVSLRQFLSRAPDTNREGLRASMLSWCGMDGVLAKRASISFLRQINATTYQERIADAWSPGGVFWSRSPLTAGSNRPT